MTENELKEAVLKEAKKCGWAVYHVTQAYHQNGGGRGYPDLTLARDGEHLWIELKQEKAMPTTEQLAWAAAIGRGWHLIRPSDLEGGRLFELLR